MERQREIDDLKPPVGRRPSSGISKGGVGTRAHDRVENGVDRGKPAPEGEQDDAVVFADAAEMLAHGFPAAGNSDNILDHLGELPLEIDGKAVAAAKSDDPDLAGAEQRFCERIDLGLRDVPESPVEIFLALREMGIVPVAAGLAAGMAEKQARPGLAFLAGEPPCLLVVVKTDPSDEARDRRLRYVGKPRQFLRVIARQIAWEVAEKLAQATLGRMKIRKRLANSAEE